MPHSAHFHPLHIDRSGEFLLDLPPGHAFPLFSPEGERAWVPDWDPAYLHPTHPSQAVGTLFRTTHSGEETLWMVLTYSPAEGTACYCRITPGSRIGTVEVQCQEQASGHTSVRVAYSLTGLSPAGNEVLKALSPAKYEEMLSDWQNLITMSQRPKG